MNFLILEKEEVECGCFQSSQNHTRRIFRSSSTHLENNDMKNADLLMVKKISDKNNSNKKSLRKQKSFNIPPSSKNGHSRQLSKDQSNFSDINAQISKQAEPITSDFSPMPSPKMLNPYENRHRSFYTIKPKYQQLPSLSQQIISNPKVNSYHPTYHSVSIVIDKEYEKLVDDEFRKDMQEFQINMKLCNQNSNLKADINQQKPKQDLNIIINLDQNLQIKEEPEINENQIYTEQEINELEKKIQKLTDRNNKKTQKKEIQVSSLQKIESLSQICQQNQSYQNPAASEIKRPTTRRERRDSSFRNSAISYKGRELQTKKFKDKMYAKQIQSEKDGSSSESSKMSQVVGRGWDGLTEQRIQIQGLDEIMFDQKKNGQTETMITQESHIKSSQMKTFTQYTNSFISPKTHKPTSTFFGTGFPKYGVTGMSYQHIDDFTRLNNSFLLTRKEFSS